MKEKFSMLYLSSDRHPAKRVDVRVLFAEKLSARGHRIDFALQSEAECAKAYETDWLGCRVVVGRSDNGDTRLARLRKHIYSVMHDIASAWRMGGAGYDFIQLKDKYVSALMLVPMAKFYGARFIYWLSFPFPEESLVKAKEPDARYPLFYWLRGQIFDFLFYRFIAKKADFIFVQSEQMKRDLVGRGVPDGKMMPVPMGVALERFDACWAASRDELDSGEAPVVLYLGILARVRRMDFLIRVFAHVLEAVPGARLHLVGGGDDEKDIEILRREAERMNVADRLLITGWLPMEEAMRYVTQASVCVSPFFPTPILNSTSPTKLVEYMAMGKAVVANDHPEQRLVIEESGAGLCVPYEERAFADAIIELLRNPKRAAEMGRRGREYVERHRSYDRIADAVEKKYLELLNQKTE